MICYRDMTFCGFKGCEDSKECPRAITSEVRWKALRWATSFHDGDMEAAREYGPGIAQYMDEPECFKGKI